MGQFETLWPLFDEEERFGEFVFHDAMPTAIRSLEDDELQTLLVALLQEWRNRRHIAGRTGHS